jgi:hypothetical protein
MHWWRVSPTSLWHMRRALGVTRTSNEGSRRLIREAAQLGADVAAEREVSNAERAARRETSQRLGLGRHRREGFDRARAWKAKELRLLGKAPDAEVAARTGRSVEGVRQKREELGIPNPASRKWTAEELAVLAAAGDAEVARRTGRTAWAVYLKRKALRVSARKAARGHAP